MVEAGYPDIEGDSWVGVLVPAGTPKDIIKMLNREISNSLAEPIIKERLETLGLEPVGTTPEQFAKQIQFEVENWGKVIGRRRSKRTNGRSSVTKFRESSMCEWNDGDGVQSARSLSSSRRVRR
jgi:Tripartite tricarboxylate transporter family receptor